MTKKLYQILASVTNARLLCEKTGNTEWYAKHGGRINDLVYKYMPSGSGWDNGTKFDYDASTGEKLVFYGSFHHMTNDGYYDGWTEYRIIVRPSLVFGLDIRITGRDRNDIKEYLHEIFDCALNQEIEG